MRNYKILVIGKSNVGKSSLINCLTDNNSALVSEKVHSTRLSTFHSFYYRDNLYTLIDSPGTSINDNNLLSQAMQNSSLKNILNSDLVILVITASSSYEHEKLIIDKIKFNKKKYLICLNKTDILQSTNYIDTLKQSFPEDNIIEISVKTNTGISTLLDKIVMNNITTDNGHKLNSYDNNNINIYQELIRESILNFTSEEIPYEAAVQIIESITKTRYLYLKADIIVSKANHKKIIIGKNGSMIKKIGIFSRNKIKKIINKEVHLICHVVVRDNWKNNAQLLKELGYLD